LTDMRPVFLFDVGVVVFVISSATSKTYGLFTIGKMTEQMIIEELTAVVGIKAQERKRKHFFDVFDLFQDAFFSFAPDGSLFRPSGGDVGKINGIGIHAHQGIATMSYRVGFKKTWSAFIPLVGVNGDLFSQKRSRFGRGFTSFLILNTDRFENPVNG